MKFSSWIRDMLAELPEAEFLSRLPQSVLDGIADGLARTMIFEKERVIIFLEGQPPRVEVELYPSNDTCEITVERGRTTTSVVLNLVELHLIAQQLVDLGLTKK